MDESLKYTSEERIASFRKHAKLSSSGYEDEVILEASSMAERANMTTLEDFLRLHFYLHIHVVLVLGFIVLYPNLRRRF